MSLSESFSSTGVPAQSHWLDTFRTLDASLPRYRPTDVDVERMRSRLDAEAETLRLVLSAVNERRNELALPSLLPPEILARIFSCLVDIYPMKLVSSIYDRNKRKTLGWLYVTHVCRRWRNVGIHDPSLWTRLSVSVDRPWDTFLERAKGASLYITCDHAAGQSSAMDELVQLIHQHQHHIQELSLGWLNVNTVRKLAAGLTGSLPHLHKLTMTTSSNGSDPLVPLHLGALSAPNLQQLQLAYVALQWGGVFPNLTRFEYAYVNSRMSYSFAEVVSALRGMPSLKSLRLVDALRKHTSSSPLPDTIHLARLFEIDITARNSSSWLLWSLLEHPLSASVQITGTCNTNTVSMITSRLRDHFHAPLSPHFQTMEIQTSRGSGSLNLELSEAKEPYGTGDEISDSVVPYVVLDVQYDDAQSMARQLIGAVPLECMHTIATTSNLGSDQSFYDTFISARSVANLYVHHGAEAVFPALMPALSWPAETPIPHADCSNPASKATVLFPSLRYLWCKRVSFNTICYRSGERIPVHSMLGVILEERQKILGEPLQRVRIEACDVLQEWFGGWTKYVGEIDWDGSRGGFDSESDISEED